LTTGWACYKNSESLPSMRLDTLKTLSQLLVTVSPVKAFFGYSKDKQDTLIKFAETPSGANAEETSEDV
jgi:hypothetical protein